MTNIAVVYWSGTGNTQLMAEAVLEGALQAGAQGKLFTSAEFSPAAVEEYSAIAFGCPSMGAEQLEETEFEPMFMDCEPALRGKKIALFGSYGWGDGEWMRNWENTCAEDGAVLVGESVICNGAPDENTREECLALGAALAG